MNPPSQSTSKAKHSDNGQITGPDTLAVFLYQAEIEEVGFNLICTLSCNFTHQNFVTHTQRKTSAPAWNEEFHFYADGLTPTHEVYIKLFAKDHFQTTLIGECTITAEELCNVKGNSVEGWYPLIISKNFKWKKPSRISVKLFYNKDIEKSNTVILHTDPKQTYKIEQKLGSGAFAVVKLVRHRVTKEEFAMKIIMKEKLKAIPSQMELLKREIMVVSKLDHPSIVKLYEAYDSPTATCLVLELASGGSVLERLLKVGAYSEEETAIIMRQLLEACVYLKSRGIAHRDLKPDNLLLTQSGRIKISDFGLSKDYSKSALQTSVGTANYVAPEVLSGHNYDFQCDVWSCGVIAYTLLSAQMPFYGEDNREIFQKIIDLDYLFPDRYFKNVSDIALGFIESIFVTNPNERMTARPCLHHPWTIMWHDDLKQAQAARKEALSRSSMNSESMSSGQGNVESNGEKTRKSASTSGNPSPPLQASTETKAEGKAEGKNNTNSNHSNTNHTTASTSTTTPTTTGSGNNANYNYVEDTGILATHSGDGQ